MIFDQLNSHKIFIFDLDDTLIDTRNACILSILQIYKSITKNSIIPESDEINLLLNKFGSNKIKIIIKSLFNKLNLSIQPPENKIPSEEDYHKLIKLNLLRNEALISEIQKIPISSRFIISNGRSVWQRDKFSHSKLDKYFNLNSIYVSGDYGSFAEKPNVYMFEKLYSILLKENSTINKSDLIYFGDKKIDMLAAEKFGIKFCLVQRKDWELSQFDLLKKVTDTGGLIFYRDKIF